MADDTLVDSDQYGSFFETLNCTQRGEVIETEIVALSLQSIDLIPALNTTWSYSWMPQARGIYCMEAHATDAAGNVENTAFGGPISILVLPTPTPTPIPTSTPTPTPTPTPPPICTSNCGGGGGGTLTPYVPNPTPAPAPEVLGATDESLPEVLGITSLPETSISISDSIVVSLFSAMMMTGMMMLMIGYGLVPKRLEDYLN